MSPGPAGTKTTQLWRTLERQLPDGFAPRHQWLWILPAGTVPAPDALQKLEDRLFTVKDEKTHRHIQIIGAKVAAQDPGERRLINAGLWGARSGEVVALNEPRELDQGQYDGRDDVPGVSAHGMLVHAPLFGDLGGFDPTLPADCAALQLCEAARETGAQIVLEPTAVVRRPAASAADQGGIDPDRIHRFGGSLHLPPAQRAGQIRRRLAAANPLAVPFLWAGMWAAAALRLLLLVLVKAPDAGLSQFAASAGALLNWAALAHTRSFRVTGRKAVLARLERDGQIDSAAETLRAGREENESRRLSPSRLRSHRRRSLTAETVALRPGFHRDDSRARERAQQEAEDEALLAVGAADGEFDEMPSQGSGDRLGLFLVLLGLTGISLLAFRSLLPAEALTGGAALPVSPSVQEVLHHTTSFVAPEGFGDRAAADPFTVILLLLSLISFGHASTLLVWLVILALPLSALTAWAAAGLWTRSAVTRVIASLLWAAVPTLHLALGEGRIGTVAAHVLLPLVALTTVRAVQARGSWEHAAGAALLLAVLTAVAPVLLPLAVLVIIALAVVLRVQDRRGNHGRRLGRTLWLIPLPALALSFPMLASAAVSEKNVLATLIAEPTPPAAPGISGESAPLWQQLLGYHVAFDPAAGLAGAGQAGSWLPGYFAGDFWSLRIALLIGAPLLALAVLGIFSALFHRRPAGPGTPEDAEPAGFRASTAVAVGLVLLTALGLSAGVSQLAAGDDGLTLLPGSVAPLVSVIVFCLLAAAIGSLARLPQALRRVGGYITPVAATLLVLSVLASLVLWAVPRSAPASELSEAPLTAVNQQTTAAGPWEIRQIPASAADQGTGPAQLRTLVLEATPEGVVAELVSGQGRTLDAYWPAISVGDSPLLAHSAQGEAAEQDLLPGEELLAELVAAVVSPGAEGTAALMQELGVGFVLIPGSQDSPLADVVDTAAGLISVGPTDRGLLWRAETDEDFDVPHASGQEGLGTAWARILDAEGQTVALLPSRNREVDADLSELRDAGGEPLQLEDGEDYYLQLASERARAWEAQLDGETLRRMPADETGDGEEQWAQRFEVSGETLNAGGQLSVEHQPGYRWPMVAGVGLFLVLVALIAVPLPRSWRMLPVEVRDA